MTPITAAHPFAADDRARRSSINTRLTPNRRHRSAENDEYTGFARRVLRAYSRRVADGDVEALVHLVGRAEESNTATAESVNGLRAHGYSWAEIGARLGINGTRAGMDQLARSGPTIMEDCCGLLLLLIVRFHARRLTCNLSMAALAVHRRASQLLLHGGHSSGTPAPGCAASRVCPVPVRTVRSAGQASPPVGARARNSASEDPWIWRPPPLGPWPYRSHPWDSPQTAP